MPVCVGCGSSYSDDFRFCPHCGRAKPEPARVQVEVVSGPVKYEEATLRLAYTGRSEKQTIDKASRFLWSWLDLEILAYFFQLELVAFHPTRNKYVAVVSSDFRSFREYEVRTYLDWRLSNNKKSKVSSGWYDVLVQEGHATWTRFNEDLIRQGWMPVTGPAIERRTPSFIFGATYFGLIWACQEFNKKLKVGKEDGLYELPETRAVIDLEDGHRYRRQVQE